MKTIRELIDDGTISLDTKVLGDGPFLTTDGFMVGRNARIFSLYDYWRDGVAIHQETVTLDREENCSAAMFGDPVKAAEYFKVQLKAHDDEQARLKKLAAEAEAGGKP